MHRITLCLSGGGFRATAFHLGVIDYLVQTDQLRLLSSVYGVSGGALTAAHLAHHWEKYADRNFYPQAALDLLKRCNEGILDQVVWSSLLWQRNRTIQMGHEIESLFAQPIAPTARPTYLVCSSLTDTSQFAVELGSKRLLQLLPDHRSVREVGITKLKTSEAASMSACFPLAFQPVRLGRASTGLDMHDLGREHMVADGGIIDNLGITMASVIEAGAEEGHLFLISDAGQIFDDLDMNEAEIATALSPMRTISYLMNQNSMAILAEVRETLKSRDHHIALVKLTDARKAAANGPGPNADQIQAALAMRTSFDAFSVDELLILFRLGLGVAKLSLEPLSPQQTSILAEGLIAPEHLGKSSLDKTWDQIKVMKGSGSFGKVTEFVLRKPGLAILLVSTIVFFAAAAVGVGLRALFH